LNYLKSQRFLVACAPRNDKVGAFFKGLDFGKARRFDISSIATPFLSPSLLLPLETPFVYRLFGILIYFHISILVSYLNNCLVYHIPRCYRNIISVHLETITG
jgi:hypothetical protein